MVSTATKGTQYERELINIYESRGWTLIMRATRYRKGKYPAIVEFGCFDLVLGTSNPYGNQRLLIQCKTDALRNETIEKTKDWMSKLGMKDEVALIAVRKKINNRVVFDIFNLDKTLVERIAKTKVI